MIPDLLGIRSDRSRYRKEHASSTSSRGTLSPEGDFPRYAPPSQQDPEHGVLTGVSLSTPLLTTPSLPSRARRRIVNANPHCQPHRPPPIARLAAGYSLYALGIPSTVPSGCSLRIWRNHNVLSWLLWRAASVIQINFSLHPCTDYYNMKDPIAVAVYAVLLCILRSEALLRDTIEGRSIYFPTPRNVNAA